jgi:hypothetical protein
MVSTGALQAVHVGVAGGGGFIAGFIRVLTFFLAIRRYRRN